MNCKHCWSEKFDHHSIELSDWVLCAFKCEVCDDITVYGGRIGEEYRELTSDDIMEITGGKREDSVLG